MVVRPAAFPQAGLAFLAGLAKNNEREWFAERKEAFEASVKAPMVALVEALNAELEGIAPACVTPPAKAIPRQHRDTRFSKDKAPYRTEISAIFPAGGRERTSATGYFLSISPKGMRLIAGCYMPDAPALASLRAHLAKRHAEARRLLKAAALVKLWGELQGESLVRVPRGFEPDHPAGDLLRRKQWYLEASLPPAVVTSPALVKEISARFRAAAPFVAFLGEGL